MEHMDKSIYTMEYAAFLKLLRDVRKSAKLSQSDLAAKLGETQSFVSKCERGERRLDIVELRWWLEALDYSISDFIHAQENLAGIKHSKFMSST